MLLDTSFRVQVRAGLHCAPWMHRALATAGRGGTVRFSIGRYNTPGDIDTLARSVTADTLLHQRSIVLQRLRRMGVDVIEAPYNQIGYQLIDRYFIIKNSEAIG